MNTEGLYKFLGRYCKAGSALRSDVGSLAALAGACLDWLPTQPSINRCLHRFLCEVSMKLLLEVTLSDLVFRLVMLLAQKTLLTGQIEANWHCLLTVMLGQLSESTQFVAALSEQREESQQLEVLKQGLQPIDRSGEFLRMLATRFNQIQLHFSSEAVRESRCSWLLARRTQLHFQSHREEFVADTLFRPILDDTVRVCQSQNRVKDIQQSLDLLKDLIVQSAWEQCIQYFRRYLGEVLDPTSNYAAQSHWPLFLVEFYCGSVLAYLKKHPAASLVRWDCIEHTGILLGLARSHLLRTPPSGLRLRNFEQYMIVYSTLPSLTALLTFVRPPNSTLSFEQALATKSSEALSILLTDAFRNAKLILTRYLQLSKIKLRRLPPKTVVDPLHFTLIGKEYWRDQYHCQLLSASLLLMTDAWILIAHNRPAVPAQVIEQYSRELLLFNYQFLLETTNCLMLEFHPIETALLPILFNTPSFPYLADSCQFFLKLPWAHVILQHLPKIATTYEHGYEMAVRIASHWKGRAYEQTMEAVLEESKEALKKNSKRLNREALGKVLRSGACQAPRLAPVRSTILELL